MEKLFTTEADNAFEGLSLRDVQPWLNLTSKINRNTLAQTWESLAFDFYKSGRKGVNRPNISTVYFSGVIGFSAYVRASIFSGQLVGIELLPITVGGDDWLVLNCLNTITEFDDDGSEVYADESGQIFMINKLRVTEFVPKNVEIFTVAASNRTQLFVKESFKLRVEQAGLKGLSFRCIGELA